MYELEKIEIINNELKWGGLDTTHRLMILREEKEKLLKVQKNISMFMIKCFNKNHDISYLKGYLECLIDKGFITQRDYNYYTLKYARYIFVKNTKPIKTFK